MNLLVHLVDFPFSAESPLDLLVSVSSQSLASKLYLVQKRTAF
jgi:hypothetical protein